MRRLTLLISSLTAALTLMAAEFHTPMVINDIAVEKIYATDDTVTRLTFTDAVYIGNLPYYSVETAVTGGATETDFSVEVSVIKSEKCSEEEAALLPMSLSGTPEIDKYISVTKGVKSLEVLILPFFNNDGVMSKITQATVSISQKGALKSGGEVTPVQSYAAHSVLAGGAWYKVAVAASGLYKLTYADIKNMGVGDPAGVRVYGYGGALLDEDLSKALPRYDDLPEVAIYMEKGADGVFNDGDYILFYAQGPVSDGISADSPTHSYTYNYCSKYGYYFITCGSGDGLRMEFSDEVTASSTLQYTNTYAGYFIHSDENNLLESGREWYGYKMQGSSTSKTFTIRDTNIDTSESLLLDINLVAHSVAQTTFDFTFCGTDIGSIKVSACTSTHQAAKKGSSQKYYNITSSANLPINITYNPNATSDAGYVNHITANYYKKLILDGSNQSILITNPDDIDDDAIAEYIVSGASAETQVWDVTNPVRAIRVPVTLSGSTLTFKEDHSEFHKYVVLNPSAVAAVPTNVGTVGNQDLHALANADMVIITQSDYMSAANRLADFHRTNDGISVHVITPEPIYNEFSSGTPDVSAYRLFMKMFYDRALTGAGEMPSSLMFMGVTHYDNRGITIAQPSMVGYQSIESITSTNSYTTDDFYGLLDDGEGKSVSAATMDIAVGRLPVTTADESEAIVTKTINYVQSSTTGNWRALCTFLADNGDSHAHESQADQLATMVTDNNNSYKCDKIFLDSYQGVSTSAGTSYPGARTKVLDNIKNGTVVFTYVGHGSPNTLTTEQTITNNDIKSMYNDNLALWATATCDFARYDDGGHSGGMNVILNSHGGGVALYTTTRVVYSSENFKLMQAAFKYLFPAEDEAHKTIGEIFRLAKVSLKNNANKLNFTLLGDPEIKLHYPTNNVITDSINGLPSSEALLQALGIVTLKGHIENIDGDTLTDFNGDINITVYDKEETMSTLGAMDGTPFEYKDYPNKLFSGKATVTDGKFSTVFMVPKDISYRYGNGKILYYAWKDGSTEGDAFGNDTELTVGGSDPSYVETTEGPSIRIYMNTPEFVNGGTVNSSPVFYAHLYDNYGINVVGAGIGHNVTATLSGAASGSYNLNDYYTATLNDYKSGVIKYQFKDLAAGSYNLDFKAWNLQNISGTASLKFVVDDTVKPEIEEFTIYPNPASDHTTLYLRHDRPETILSVTFRVYDMAWNEYWSATVKGNTDGTFTAEWDLTGKQGAMASGVYCVRAIITMSDGNYTHLVKKLIVKNQ